MHRGYFALYRKIQDHPFYKERRIFSKYEAWIDILMEAQYREEPIEVTFGMTVLICHYGECLKSLRTWGMRWHWSLSKVKRFFELLKNLNQITYKSETQTTRLTVCNYEIYDIKRNGNENKPKQSRNTTETDAKTDNKDKKDKHVNNVNKEAIYSEKKILEILNLWNSLKQNLRAPNPSINIDKFLKSKSRMDKLKLRQKENPDIAEWEKVIKFILTDSFCRGENDRNWLANIDYLIKNDSMFGKILEKSDNNRQQYSAPQRNELG